MIGKKVMSLINTQ